MAKKDDPLDDLGRLKPGERRLSLFERAQQEALGKSIPLGRQDDPARTLYPELWRWMTTTDVEGNRLKEPATIILRITPEGWSATLNDRAFGYAWDANSESLETIFRQLEIELLDPTKARKSHNRDPKTRKRKTP